MAEPLRIRPMRVWALRGSKRTHLPKHTLASYPRKEVAMCDVSVGAGRVGFLTAYFDSHLTCPECRKVAPWLKRGRPWVGPTSVTDPEVGGSRHGVES